MLGRQIIAIAELTIGKASGNVGVVVVKGRHGSVGDLDEEGDESAWCSVRCEVLLLVEQDALRRISFIVETRKKRTSKCLGGWERG